MQPHIRSFALLILLLSFPLPTPAQWPTTIRENLPVAASPDTMELYPFAFPYPDESTMVIFKRNWVGNSYQMIDRYGYLVYPEPQSLWPAVNSPDTDHMKAIPDGERGVLACWMNLTPIIEEGIFAQRLDSLGNICWGDSGKKIYPLSECNYDVYADDSGGLFFTCLREQTYPTVGVIVQHIDAIGQPMWGDSGSWAYLTSSHGLGFSSITRDDNGGAYVVWIDFRPPYLPYGALFMQHVDSQGYPTWNPEGIYICYNTWFKQMIPDGENGFLLHTNPDALELNTVFRFGPNGNMLWRQDGVSRICYAKMVAGEPGFFYLGFNYLDYILGNGIYGQRMDIEGNVYWPTGSQIGAPMAILELCGGSCGQNFAYRYPYFYGIYVCHHPPNNYPFYLLAQSLDSLGNRRYGDDGSILTYINTDDYMYLNVVPDDQGGAVSVWQSYYTYDIWAKHVNADGTLGGPTWAPPPVQHKPAGPILGSVGQTIKFQIAVPGEMKLELFDLLGRRVAVLEEGFYSAGNYTTRYNPQNLASGIYLLRLRTPRERETIKIAVIR